MARLVTYALKARLITFALNGQARNLCPKRRWTRHLGESLARLLRRADLLSCSGPFKLWDLLSRFLFRRHLGESLARLHIYAPPQTTGGLQV